MSFEELALVITGIITVYFIAATFSDLHGYEKLKEEADESLEQYYSMLEKRNADLRKENEHLRRECIVLRRRLDGKGEEKWAGETETEGLTEGMEAVKMENGKKD
jgi:hypothetical protein